MEHGQFDDARDCCREKKWVGGLRSSQEGVTVHGSRGLSLIETLIAVAALILLTALLIVTLRNARERARRAHCVGNLEALIQACLYYDDATPSFPDFPRCVAARDDYSESGDGHTQYGRLALSQLYGVYVKDHRVFCCPGNPSDTGSLRPYIPPIPPTVTGYTNYGYDPGHSGTHTNAGVLSDMGKLDPKTGSSANHGVGQASGQNVAFGAGHVDWLANRRIQVQDADMNPRTDDIFANDWDERTFPEELETWIVE